MPLRPARHRRSGVSFAARVLGPPMLPLGSPHARAAQCMCYCPVRLLGLPSATPPYLYAGSPRSLMDQCHCTVRVLGPPVLISLYSPRARAAWCVCQCSVRLPGLPNATPPTCRLYHYTTRVALVRSLGPPFPSPGLPYRPLRPADTPTAPQTALARPLRRLWVRHGAGLPTWPALQANGPRRPMGRATQR